MDTHAYKYFCLLPTDSSWPQPRCSSGVWQQWTTVCNSVCVCVCTCMHSTRRVHAYMHSCMYTSIDVCVCVCSYVCVIGEWAGLLWCWWGVFGPFLNIAALLWLPRLWCCPNLLLRGSHFRLLTLEKAMTSRLGGPTECSLLRIDCWGGKGF